MASSQPKIQFFFTLNLPFQKECPFLQKPLDLAFSQLTAAFPTISRYQKGKVDHAKPSCFQMHKIIFPVWGAEGLI